MNQDFAKVLVDDYVALGFGSKVNDYTIRGLSGQELEFLVIEEDGESVGLEVYHNGDMVRDFAYSDVNFSRELALFVTGLTEAAAIHS